MLLTIQIPKAIWRCRELSAAPMTFRTEAPPIMRMDADWRFILLCQRPELNRSKHGYFLALAIIIPPGRVGNPGRTMEIISDR